MKKFCIISLAVLLVSILFVVQIPAFAYDGDGVYFYEHFNYRGRYNAFHEEINIPRFSDYWVGNDQISAIKIVGLYEVTVYEHENYKGVSHTYRFSDSNVSNEVIENDRISSAKIRKISKKELNGVYLYQHDTYSGKWIKLTSSIRSLDKTRLGNDQASSVRVVGDYEYILHRDINYSGPSFKSNINNHWLGDTYVGNDEVSSVTVKRK